MFAVMIVIISNLMLALSCSICVQLFAALQTLAHQTPLSVQCSQQEYWSGLPCPPPGDLYNLRAKLASPASPALQVDCLPLGEDIRSKTRQMSCIKYLFSSTIIFDKHPISRNIKVFI